MTIACFFDRTVIISRLKDIVGTNKKQFVTTATVDCATPQSNQDQAGTQIDMVQDRSWVTWFPEEQDVQEGDRITDSISGRSYKVLEVTQKDYYSTSNKHLEVLLVDHED